MQTATDREVDEVNNFVNLVLAMSYVRYGYSQRILGSHSICQAKAPPLSKVDYLTMLSYALLLFVHPIFANEILFVGQR